MFLDPKIFCLALCIFLCTIVFGQDSLYATRIDSLWLNTYHKNKLLKKQEKNNDRRFDYVYYKESKQVRSIIAWDAETKPHLIIFFYVENKVAMISPVGQQPYFILDDKFVFGKEKKHSLEEIQELIRNAKRYLLQAQKLTHPS